jgi:biopolymer transport protein ExbB
MVATQEIQVGMIHAGKTVTVLAEDDSFWLVVGGETVAVVPRTSSREVQRYKAYAAHQGFPADPALGRR